MMVQVTGLKKSYGNVEVLKGIDFQFPLKDQCVITGSSGSGKSTFLYLLGGLEDSCAGDIRVGDQSLSSFDDEALAHYRNKQVGFIFQFHFLLQSMSVRENIYLPMRIGGRSLSKEHKDRVEELANRLGVHHCLEKYPYQLSGGEQQRVNIIRAVSTSPQLLLCDEPTGNLDSQNTEKVVELLKDVSKELNIGLIVVTHDEEVSKHFSQSFHMEDGLLH